MLNSWENKVCKSANKTTIQNKAVIVNKTTMSVIIKTKEYILSIYLLEKWKTDNTVDVA